MHYHDEPVEAHCFIDRADDPRNAVYLTNRSLIVCRSGKDHTFLRERIQLINFARRTFLIPIVAGGIIAPLGIIALVNMSGNVWLLFLVIAAGLFIHYYGWVGGLALVIKTPEKDYDIFIPHASPPLKAFVRYASWQIRYADRHVYLLATEEEWDYWQTRGSVPAGTEIHFEQPAHREKILFSADALATPLSMNFSGDADSSSTTAFLAGDFPLDYIERC